MTKSNRNLIALLLLFITLSAHSQIIINEIDVDTVGSDVLEFVELYGPPNTELDGMILVFYNGNGDTSYSAIDLDGETTNANGFFVAGNAAVANVSVVFSSNGLQNGADAVALYTGNGADFPNGTPVTNVNLIDALVYDTNDADDVGLIDVLTPGQAQINEDGGIDKDIESNSRFPDGGTALVTSTYIQQAPTPGTTNVPPEISINDVTQVEGNAGTTTFDFTVSISYSADALVNFTTSDGTAMVSDSDYIPDSSIIDKFNGGPTPPITFTAGGATTQTLSVTVNGDTTIEQDETFFVNLIDANGAIIADPQGQGTILNDDFSIISIDDVSQIEGDTGTTTFDFTISLTNSTDVGLQVHVTGGTASVADSDFVPFNNQPINFTAGGPTSQVVSVTVNGDTTIEADETFFVTLTVISGNSISFGMNNGVGTGTIINDDFAILSIDDVSQNEGDAGTTTFDFTLSLTQSTDLGLQVHATGGTASSADFVPFMNQPINFTNGGPTSQVVSVTVNGDTTIEANETFFVTLTAISGSNYIFGDNNGVGTGTIINDDSANITIDDVTQSEGDAGSTTFDFTVSIDSSNNASVQVDTADISATTGDSDYDAIVAQVVNFTAGGATTQTVSVTVNGDTAIEPNETFSVNLSNVTGTDVSIGDAQGIGTINNDDSSTISINDVTQSEGDAGATLFNFNVSISTAANASVQVDTSDGTATIADNDYAAIVGQIVNFTIDGPTTQVVSVSVNGDTTIEETETFNVNLSNVIGDEVTISDAQGIGTITNNDALNAIVLSPIKSVSGDLNPGGLITYEIVMTNTGPNAQNDNPGDEMTDELPTFIDYISSSATSGVVSFSNNVVAWNGSIPPGETVTVTIDAIISVNASGTIRNQAIAYFDNDGDNINESTALSNGPIVLGPTSFFIAVMVPTLNQYMIVLLMLMIILVALRRIRT